MEKRAIKILIIFILLVFVKCQWLHTKIDRYKLVKRHNPELKELNPLSPFTVGNGKFAFTADVTGLQTFPEIYRQEGIPLETLSHWAWHTFPNPENYSLKDAYESISVGDKVIQYPTKATTPAGKWLRANPHRIPLGQIGMDLIDQDGSSIQSDDLSEIHQYLDMWRGMLESAFKVQDVPVQVTTTCHPEQDLVAVRIKSPLIETGRLGLSIKFPYSHDHRIKNNPPLDWDHPEKHRTDIMDYSLNHVNFKRSLDNETYYVGIAWSGSGVLKQVSGHHFVVTPSGNESAFHAVFAFSANEISEALPSFSQTLEDSKVHWKNYWRSGGAVDLSGSKDELAQELERRIVLSQYLTRVQCAGSIPTQESGLTFSSWHGKFHTEMIWWNTAHHLLWGREELLLRTYSWYLDHLGYAKRTAGLQGFSGARWSKMVGPEGRESPGNNPFIFWNQPHPIYLAEMIYRINPRKTFLERYKDVLFETADYMADFVQWNAAEQRYDIGPPVWPVQEVYEPRETRNPVFELAYWSYGLKIAQVWRERIGLDRKKKWDHVIAHLAPLPVYDSVYVAAETFPETFINPLWCTDHPSMLMPLGFLPGHLADRKLMKKTLEMVLRHWDWETKIWGWDYPMIAMTAARLGEPKLAVGVLLMDAPNNQYLNNGHCPQRESLPAYLPANGALLSAVAMMAAGWEDAPEIDCPGFPKDGNWKIRWEGLKKMP
ncbi:hypothetical protein JW835_16235 [bacterium]|nr:hypothetical protein [bacterium]